LAKIIIYAKIRINYIEPSVAQCLYAFNKSVYFWKSTVNLGFKLKTEQLQIVEMFWQVFSLDICFDKSKSMDTNPCTCWYFSK
jgi:hypothetical protein